MKKYIDDMKNSEILVMLETPNNQTFFKHKETAVCFSNHFNHIFVYDVEDLKNSIKINSSFYNLIKSHYINLDKLIYEFKNFEELMFLEILFIDDTSKESMTLRQLELLHNKKQ